MWIYICDDWIDGWIPVTIEDDTDEYIEPIRET